MKKKDTKEELMKSKKLKLITNQKINKMTEIVPAVLAKNYTDLSQKIAQYVNIAKIVQIDICDGSFVESISWPMGAGDIDSVNEILNEEEGLPFWKDLDFELDLMVLNAHKKFDFFMRLGAKRIIFHLEAEKEEELIEFLESMDPYCKDNIDIGLAINTQTDISKIDPFINYVDFVQCMGIEKIGFQGQDFDEKVINQIKKLRQKYSELKISVDGGINENTATLLKEAGADRLVIGSALMESLSIIDTFRNFENL